MGPPVSCSFNWSCLFCKPSEVSCLSCVKNIQQEIKLFLGTSITIIIKYFYCFPFLHRYTWLALKWLTKAELASYHVPSTTGELLLCCSWKGEKPLLEICQGLSYKHKQLTLIVQDRSCSRSLWCYFLLMKVES